MTEDVQETYADKIAKLLRKAETTDSATEADALNAKAQQLMVKYQITDELLAQAEGRERTEKIVQETIRYRGVFHRALFNIGWAITKSNDCRGLINLHTNDTELLIVGFESDVAHVKMLDMSLQIQASTAMQRWYRGQDVTGLTPMQKYKMRREFFMAFARGLDVKLQRARAAGINEAVVDEAARSGVAADQVKHSTDLVLVSKQRRVDEWMDSTYGGTLRQTRRNYASGGIAARQAGYAAGMSADVGGSSIGGGRKAIGEGG